MGYERMKEETQDETPSCPVSVDCCHLTRVNKTETPMLFASGICIEFQRDGWIWLPICVCQMHRLTPGAVRNSSMRWFR